MVALLVGKSQVLFYINQSDRNMILVDVPSFQMTLDHLTKLTIKKHYPSQFLWVIFFKSDNHSWGVKRGHSCHREYLHHWKSFHWKGFDVFHLSLIICICIELWAFVLNWVTWRYFFILLLELLQHLTVGVFSICFCGLWIKHSPD